MTRHKFTILMAAALVGLFSASNRGQAQAGSDSRRQQTDTSLRPMTYADLERLYLDGKITAKQYQKYLNELKSRPTEVTTPAKAVPTNNPSVVRLDTNAPAATVPQVKDDHITAVETKMDELLKAKAARDKAATNAPPAISAGPKTKRDRLNELLRLYIEGKITEPEMNERRAKIIAEPE